MKTTNSISGRIGLLEVTISAAVVAALSGLTTAEDVNFSQAAVMIEETTSATRETDAQPVIGDKNPILTQSETLSTVRYKITLLYTKGSDQLGTDNVDAYTDIIRPAFMNATPLSLPHSWTFGGEGVEVTGQERYTTDADETYIVSVQTPTPSANNASKIALTYEIECPMPTVSVVA